jgi:hypothetical protein
MRPNPQPVPPLPPAFRQDQNKPVQDNQSTILLIAVLMAGAQLLPKIMSLTSDLLGLDLYYNTAVQLFLGLVHLGVLAVPLVLVLQLRASSLKMVVIILASLNLLLSLYYTFFYYGGFF